MSVTKQQVAVDLIGYAEMLGRLMAADIAVTAAGRLLDKGDKAGAATLMEFAEFLRAEPAKPH